MTSENANQSNKANPRKRVDWDAIAPHYRAGIRALKDIGKQFDVSDAAIIKHAKNEKWTRDLKGKIQAKADAKVSAAMVSAEVSAAKKLTEALTVEVESTVQSRIRLSHRADIGKSRTLAMRLLDELDSQTRQVPELEQLGELMLKPDGKGIDKLNELYHKIISLPGRTKTMKDLSDTLKTLIGLEREAFGINVAEEGPEDAMKALLTRLQGTARTITPVADDIDLQP
jgi:hypothetical protein